MSVKHLAKTAQFLVEFAQKRTIESIRSQRFVTTRFRRTPTTLCVYYGDELRISVSADGSCRFINCAEIPQLVELALMEGKNYSAGYALDKAPRLTWMRVPYPLPMGFGSGTPIDHEIRAKGDHEVVTHGSKKIVVPATAKYGQSGGKGKAKYDKSATLETSSESRTTGIRPIRSRAESSSKVALMQSGYTPIQLEPKTEYTIIRRTLPKNAPKPKMTKKRGKLISRQALAMMEHKPLPFVSMLG